MKTPATEELPKINWEQNKLMDSDIDERSETWEMSGVGPDNERYVGTGEYSCGELITITDIELDSNNR